jgi:hypothetical protein
MVVELPFEGRLELLGAEPRRLAVSGVLQNGREFADQLPRREEDDPGAVRHVQSTYRASSPTGAPISTRSPVKRA